MIHPHTELRFISDEVGYGVVATQLIPKGTITWAQDKLDRVLTPKKASSLGTTYRGIIDKYCFRNNKGNYVLCWDISRYVNHSFNSNCLTTSYDFEMAIRDIHPGEELTDDYGYLNIEEPFDCLPEKGTLRTRVMPDDLLHNYIDWDRQLDDAFRHFNSVAQPLQPFVKKHHWERCIAIALQRERPDSILNCYYDPNEKGKVAL